MGFTLFTARFCSTVPGGPTYTEIRSTLTPVGQRGEGWGTFVGPGPRVTRTRLDGGCGWATTAAWLYTWTGGADYDELTRLTMRDEARRALERSRASGGLGYWANVEALPYSPAQNGSIEWWRDGRGASATATRDDWDVFVQGENPLGPNDALPHAPGWLDGLKEVKPILFAIGGIMALWYLGPVVSRALIVTEPASRQLAARAPTQTRRVRR